jgi:serine/threonine protein kinase
MSTWRLDGFTEVGELGSGAQGRVVLARRGESGPFVAIKYVSSGGDAGGRVPSQREARILASVDDEHVARLHEMVEGPDGVAIVMEAVEGVSLDKLLREHGALEPEAALLVLKGSLLGLAAAHAAGVVHRDYKPANVIVAADGASKLIDFGIATPSGERSLAGTPIYMAPEQWAGEPASPATDVYAATCVFFECVTGHPPYAGDNQMALMAQHTTAAPPVDQVPEPLRELVAHGMAKQAAQRPPEAAEFVTELEEAAVDAYGEDWERRGLVALASSAAALAALFPQAVATSAVGSTIGTTTLGLSALGGIRHLPARLGRTRFLATVAVAAAVVVAIATVAWVLNKQSEPISLSRGRSSASPAPASPTATPLVPTPSPSLTPTPSPSPSLTPSPAPSPSLTPAPSSPVPVVAAGNPTTTTPVTGPSGGGGTVSPTITPPPPPCLQRTLAGQSFGGVEVGGSATRTISIPWAGCYNAGGIRIQGSAAFVRPPATNCPPAAGSTTCTVTVIYRPTAPTAPGAPPDTATLVVPDQAGAGRVTARLTGTGTAASTDCFPYATQHDIGEVPVNTTKQLDFTYPWEPCDGIDQMQVTGGGGQFTAKLTICPPPAGSNYCSFTVTFTPSDIGPQSATIIIPSDTGGQAVQIILTGTGTNGDTKTSLTPSPGTSTPAPGVSDPAASPAPQSPAPEPSAPEPSTATPGPEAPTATPGPEAPTVKPGPEAPATVPEPEAPTVKTDSEPSIPKTEPKPSTPKPSPEPSTPAPESKPSTAPQPGLEATPLAKASPTGP